MMTVDKQFSFSLRCIRHYNTEISMNIPEIDFPVILSKLQIKSCVLVAYIQLHQPVTHNVSFNYINFISFIVFFS